MREGRKTINQKCPKKNFFKEDLMYLMCKAKELDLLTGKYCTLMTL
jgi:hypothetical protein